MLVLYHNLIERSYHMAKITKEEILTALKEGRVSYRPIGEARVSPFKAREYLLKVADKIERGEFSEVDLSIAFDRCDIQQAEKITTHKSSISSVSKQNQYQ